MLLSDGLRHFNPYIIRRMTSNAAIVIYVWGPKQERNDGCCIQLSVCKPMGSPMTTQTVTAHHCAAHDNLLCQFQPSARVASTRQSVEGGGDSVGCWCCACSVLNSISSFAPGVPCSERNAENMTVRPMTYVYLRSTQDASLHRRRQVRA